MTPTRTHALCAIYRRADDYPVVITIRSDSDIFNLLGYGAIRVSQIDDNILVFSRADAYENGEPLSLTHSYSEDDVLCTKYIYGDVVVVGYDPELDEAISLTPDQLSRWLFTPEDLE